MAARVVGPPGGSSAAELELGRLDVLRHGAVGVRAEDARDGLAHERVGAAWGELAGLCRRPDATQKVGEEGDERDDI